VVDELKVYERVVGFHSSLNKKELLPENCYRRNSLHFNLVNTVNSVIGLFLSQNYEPIPVLLRRAFDLMEQRSEVAKKYIQFSECYMLCVAYYIQEHTSIDMTAYVPRLPEKLLSLRWDELPEVSG